ncbi:MAG TPA: hypothetical protein VHC97_04475 [Thermoanaerobaculia bacterium]|jgi:uncharacterized protein YjeT (DUF2065 family)|nr:hypothetical protein [Thermoanaerobaculia bacterium]
MEASVQLFAAINFLVVGISHILAPRAWANFFDLLRQKGEPGVFVVGFMSLFFGSIIAAFHNVWSGLPVVLTVIGWAQVLKALIYFAFPSFGLRRLGTVPPERARLFVYGGFFSLALAGFFIYLFAAS